MPDLFLRKRKVESVFELLGDHENDITFSAAWALAKSPQFLSGFIKHALGTAPRLKEATIRLQRYEKGAGITDIEIESPGTFFFIVEAKRGWNLPTLQQLRKYARRKSFTDQEGVRRLIVLSECSREYTFHCLSGDSIEGAKLEAISWKELAGMASGAQRRGSNTEKRLLKDFLIYLRGSIDMQNNDSNWVFVVSLGSGTKPGWKISWIDIVTKRSAYFHPVGNHWPKEPPNYIAFRYRGKLQSIHHIEKAKVFTNPHEIFRDIPSEQWAPHFLYTLGPAFRPQHEVKMGKLYPNARNWCMLDTLFTCKTISDARDLSDRRRSAEKP